MYYSLNVNLCYSAKYFCIGLRGGENTLQFCLEYKTKLHTVCSITTLTENTFSVKVDCNFNFVYDNQPTREINSFVNNKIYRPISNFIHSCTLCVYFLSLVYFTEAYNFV